MIILYIIVGDDTPLDFEYLHATDYGIGYPNGSGAGHGTEYGCPIRNGSGFGDNDGTCLGDGTGDKFGDGSSSDDGIGDGYGSTYCESL